jgi:hypothetical protein
MESDLVRLRAWIAPSRIAFVKYILEGYDNLAQLSTVDLASGEIILRFHPSNRQILLPLLDELLVKH